MKYADISVTTQGNVPVARIEGEIDIANSPELGARLVRMIANTAPGLVVDLSGTSYVDSAALQLLLDLNDRLGMRGQQLRIVVPPEALIRRLFELTHINEAIPMDGTVEDAVGALDGTASANGEGSN
jgi:anti-anti-sigma factor